MEIVARTEYVKMIELQNLVKNRVEFEKKKAELSSISMYNLIRESHTVDSYSLEFKLRESFDDIHPVYLREFSESAGKNNQILIVKRGISYSLVDLSGTVHDTIQMDKGWRLQLSTVGYTSVYFIKQEKMKIFSFRKQKNERKRDKNDQLYSRYIFKFHEELAMEHEFDLEKSRLVADYKDSQKTSFAIVDENHQIYKVEGSKVIKHNKTAISEASSTDYTISFGFPYIRVCNYHFVNSFSRKKRACEIYKDHRRRGEASLPFYLRQDSPHWTYNKEA